MTSLLHRVIRKLTPAAIQWQSIAFFRLDLQKEVTAAPSDNTLQTLDFHIIDSPEDNWLAELCYSYPHKHFHLRLIHDCQQCHVVEINGMIVAYAWVTTSSCHISEINFHLSVRPGSIYIYDCFVHAAHRQLGIYQTLLAKILADYRLPRWPERYHTAWIAAEPSNTASVRGIERAGFEESAMVRYLQLWAFTRWYGANSLEETMRNADRKIVSD